MYIIFKNLFQASYYCKIWQDIECMEIKPPWNKLLKVRLQSVFFLITFTNK